MVKSYELRLSNLLSWIEKYNEKGNYSDIAIHPIWGTFNKNKKPKTDLSQLWATFTDVRYICVLRLGGQGRNRTADTGTKSPLYAHSGLNVKQI